MIIAKNDLNDLGQSFHSRETARETFITQRCRSVTLRLFSLSYLRLVISSLCTEGQGVTAIASLVETAGGCK